MLFAASLLLSCVGGAGAAATGDGQFPAIAQVLGMLRNLVSMIETESSTDDEEHASYKVWSAGETATTSQHVKLLQSEIQTTSAALADLGTQKRALDQTVAKVTADLEAETTQLNAATERRTQENTDFMTEQQNFDSAISACLQAVEILEGHYGSEENAAEKPLKKPGFLGLIHKALGKVKTAAEKVQTGKLSKKAAMLIQKVARSPGSDTYKDSSAEGGDITSQIKELSATFADDKQAGIEAEHGLQEAYVTLRDQKNELIGTLTTERDTQQSQLDGINQGIAENQGSLAMAQDTLRDKQTYLQGLGTQLSAAETSYRARVSDRDAEKTAINQAIGVLEGVSFLQTGVGASEKASSVDGRTAGDSVQVLLQHFKDNSAVQHIAGRARALQSNSEILAAAIFSDLRHDTTAKSLKAGESQLRGVGSGCKNCQKAVALLRSKATWLHSTMLTMAATTAMALGNDQIDDVVARLQSLVRNLDQEQASEKAHKEWCVKETSGTTQKRDGHTAKVDELQAAMNSLSELINMKKTALEENTDDIIAENAAWRGVQQQRDTDKNRYDQDLQDTLDAIEAMNQAIGILTKFYANRKKAMLQQEEPVVEDPEARIMLEAIDPKGESMMQSPEIDRPQLVQIKARGFAKKTEASEKTNPNSGSQVITMMSIVRNEFNQAETELRHYEQIAVTANEAARAVHQQALSDYNHNNDVYTVEKQTAEQAFSSNSADKQSNQEEVVAANTYLGRLSQSCTPLIQNYDDRKRLRGEERTAIEDAIKVLREV